MRFSRNCSGAGEVNRWRDLGVHRVRYAGGSAQRLVCHRENAPRDGKQAGGSAAGGLVLTPLHHQLSPPR